MRQLDIGPKKAFTALMFVCFALNLVVYRHFGELGGL